MGRPTASLFIGVTVMDLVMEILSDLWAFLALPQVATVTLILGVMVAVRSINAHRLTERQKETVQLLFTSRTDDNLEKGLSVLERIHDDPNDNIRAYGREKKQDQDAVLVRYVLNHWERIAIGVQEGTYCERIIKKANCSSLLSLHEQARPMIAAIRESTGKKTYYQELDWLAARWSKNGLKPR